MTEHQKVRLVWYHYVFKNFTIFIIVFDAIMKK